MSARLLATMGLAALLVATTASTAAAGARAPSSRTEVTQRFKLLVDDIRGLPRTAVTRRGKAALLSRARAIEKVALKDPCRANRMLEAGRFNAFLVVEALPRVNPSPVGGSARGRLQADALGLQAALMVAPGARRACDGSVRPAVTEATPVVLDSSPRRLRLRVLLPTPTFEAHRVGASDYQQMHIEGMGDSGKPGEPVVPALTKFLAIPQGANISVRIDDTNGYELDGVSLYPHQPEPVDQELPPIGPGGPPRSDFLEGPFVKSRSAYASDRRFPRRPSKGKVLGKMRELRIAGVDAAGGQYRPKSKRLRVFTSIDVTVNFRGGTGKFASAARLHSPWEAYFTRNYEATLVNWDAVQQGLDLGDLAPSFCGEDMLIVTSPALAPAAQAFASARNAAGYVAKVVQVGPDPGQIGTTLAQTQAYILGELNADCALRPTYVVLFGDTSHVPTWHVPCSDGGDVSECDIASDLPYSLNFPSDLFADVLLGRIPAPDLASANAVVQKIVGYENNAPAPPADDFYGHATVTAYFEPKYICVLNDGQSGEPNCKSENGPITGHYELDYTNHKDTRGFTKTAERIQNSMATDYGHTIDRVYTTDDENVIPETYYDNTPIPPHLLRPGFGWDGTGADLLNHYNDGRFLILHRDHGWHSGWSAPTLHSGDVPSMNNGTQLPVVFGVDCSSAQFDIPGSPSFVEQQVMKPEGGAFAGFGDTRVSPTWANNHMALGFLDAPFPLLVPTYGAAEPTKRLGDILLSGKGYMASQDGIDYQSAGATYQEHFLYHLLGDPSAQMWSNDPIDIDVTRIRAELIPIPVPDPGGPVFKVLVDMGALPAVQRAVVTLYRNGAAIGRGVVGAGGAVEITPEIPAGSDGLTVAFEQDGALPDSKAVDGPAPGPAPGPVNTAMGIDCPSDPSFARPVGFSGHLDPAFAGAPVKLTYTKAGTGGRTFDRTVATDASGDWTDTQAFGRTDRGSWTVKAEFAGDAGHNPSSAECAFTVQ